MKKIILCVLSFVPILLWAQQNKFVLKGKIGALHAPYKIYLVKAASISPDNITDSAALKDGSFEFKGQLDIARQVGLVIAADRSALNLSGGKGKASGPAPVSAGTRVIVPEYKFFYLDAGETVMNSPDSLKHATVTGASEKINNEEDELQKCLEPIRSENGDIGQFQMNTPEETQKTEAFKQEFYKRVETVDKKQAATVAKFIQDHPNSPISLYALAGNMGSQATLPQIKELYAVLSPVLRNSKAGKSYAASIARMEKTAIGATAPDFVENDVNGQPISLKDYKGKYVLLDFWASWCGPCRRENPNVLKAWNKYKDKNFVIIGVSLDQAKEPWLAAIQKDGLSWTHISGLKGFDDPVAQLYEVNAIPVNYLIDPNGKIIATRLREVALDEKLASVLDTPGLPAPDQGTGVSVTRTAAGEYIIKGKLAEKYDAPLKVYLQYADGNQQVEESAVLQKGVFEIKGRLEHPVEGTLILQHDASEVPTAKGKGRRDTKRLWIAEGVTLVTGDDLMAKATISGSSLNEEEAALDQALKPVTVEEQAVQDTLMDNYNKDPKAADKKYDEQMRALWPEREKVLSGFINMHPDSWLSLLSLDIYITNAVDISKIGPLYASLSDKLKSTLKGKETGDIVSHLENVGLGSTAPLFAQQTPDGKTVSLADFKGKYVLIDFWASWCTPCRAENPDVVKAYNTYKDKGFTVLGVSLDGEKTRTAWIEAIAKDNLTWTQISDLKDWQNAAATTYGVRAIPANFLIDPRGVIVAKNLHGAALAETLSKLIK